jgi:HEAT repeat protein
VPLTTALKDSDEAVRTVAAEALSTLAHQVVPAPGDV